MTEQPFGGDIVAQQIHKAGITHLFTLCGGHISPILVSAQEYGIEVVDVRHEASAVFSADAHARLTGRPGVAVVTAGPGVTNSVTAVKNAQMAQSPVLLIGGATPTLLKGRGSLQDIDQLSLMESLVKWQSRVTTLSDLEAAMEHGLRVAHEGVPGPVFIEAPIDLLYPRHLVHRMFAEQAGIESLSGLLGTSLRSAMTLYLKRQELQPSLLASRDALRRRKSPSQPESRLHRVAQALEKAKRPALVIGSQAMVNQNRASAEQLAGAVSRLGIPTWTGGMARGLLGADHERLFRHKRGQALKEADLVIVAGFPFDFRLGYGRGFNRNATLVAANLSRHELTMNRRPDIAIEQHAATMLQSLAERTSAGPIEDWVATLRERENAREAEIDATADTAMDGVNPVRFFRELDRRVATNDILVVDGGDFAATAAYTLRPRQPLSWLDPGAYGTLGVGGGFVLGAASARPRDRVWLIWGDGSSAYSLAEFDTFIRHGMAPIAIIGTDASWGQIAREQQTMLGDSIGTNLLFTHYEEVAKGYGGVGIRVWATDQVPRALDRARHFSDEGCPVCINLMLGRSDFREGSISM